MNSPKDTAAAAKAAVIPASVDSLRILSKEVSGGLNAPVDEKVRNKDFSDFLIPEEGEVQ